MINLAILKTYDDKFVAAIGHNYKTGKVFYKVTNKFVDDLIDSAFKVKRYREIEEDDLVYTEEVVRTDKDFLEFAVTSLEMYKIDEYYEDMNKELKGAVKEAYEENIQKAKK